MQLRVSLPWPLAVAMNKGDGLIKSRSNAIESASFMVKQWCSRTHRKSPTEAMSAVWQFHQAFVRCDCECFVQVHNWIPSAIPRSTWWVHQILTEWNCECFLSVVTSGNGEYGVTGWSRLIQQSRVFPSSARLKATSGSNERRLTDR